VPTESTSAPVVDDGDQDAGDRSAASYDTYLTSSEPVQTTSAPVWVVPGILLVLTSMLALLGGVLGGNRPVVVRVRSNPHDERPDEDPIES
jgi:hypothetical protein